MNDKINKKSKISKDVRSASTRKERKRKRRRPLNRYESAKDDSVTSTSAKRLKAANDLEHCPARFKRKDRLGRHMLIHDLTKRLKCPFRNYLGCMSEFSRPDKLKRHLLTHSNVKRFSCSHCNRNFHRAQALKHHEMNKHSLKCDICSHAFKTKEQLVTHNCEQSSETKKHPSLQLPKKASGSFKPRKPTPKRQTLSKTAIPLADKEKLEKLTDEIERKIASETFRSADFGEESSKKTNVPPVSKAVASTGGESNERSDSPVMDFEDDFKRNMEFYSPHASE